MLHNIDKVLLLLKIILIYLKQITSDLMVERSLYKPCLKCKANQILDLLF